MGERLKISNIVHEVMEFSLTAGIAVVGLYCVAMACGVDEFIKSLKDINRERGLAVQNAVGSHPEDNQYLLDIISPLTEIQLRHLAGRVARVDLGRKGKMHKNLLGEVGHFISEIISQGEK